LIGTNPEFFMDYDIPLFALNYGPEEEEAVLATLRSKWISMGPRTAQLEKTFAGMTGSPHAVAVTNCTAALHLAMEILGVGANDEVIVPSLTFVATVNAIRYVGAQPVFCDVVGPDNLNLDPRQVEQLITPRTRAIAVMHYGGFPCDMDALLAIAKKHGLALVEDACHGPLSEFRGRKLGTLGDIGCFSFFSNKNISTGEGGIMVMNNREHFEKAKLMRSHGMTSLSYERAKGHAVTYDVITLGYNYRIDDIRASLALVQLQRLRPDLEKRARIRARYVEQLRELEEVIVPFASHTGFVSNYILPIVLRKADAATREAVRDQLHGRGIQTSVHYPPAHRFSIYRNNHSSLPQTEVVSDSEISLPMHGNLKMDEVDRVVKTLKEGIWTTLKK
jgi:dTDP-4-amino-4,6-dideoxygalactose transaminase